MCYSNKLIYNPDFVDRDHWEHTMFQIQNPPVRLPSWQDYVVRIKQGEDCFPEFLHYYEPTLNSVARSFVRRYGLYDHFADVKMTYVEALLTELESYDPSSGVDFLFSVQRKLDAALHSYAMTNLKGFSETSATHYYQLRKAAFISKSCPEEAVISQICEELNIQPKSAMRLMEEAQALDSFQWYTGILTAEGQEDIPAGIDILGYCQTTQPEQELLHKETIEALHRAFEKLTYKEQDIISRHLGFYKVCFRPLPSNTFEELADLYQYSTADGVMRFYHRALRKLHSFFEETVR